MVLIFIWMSCVRPRQDNERSFAARLSDVRFTPKSGHHTHSISSSARSCSAMFLQQFFSFGFQLGEFLKALGAEAAVEAGANEFAAARQPCGKRVGRATGALVVEAAPQVAAAVRRNPIATVERQQDRIACMQLLAAHAGELSFARGGHSLAALDVVDVSRAQLVLVDAETQRDLIFDMTKSGHVCDHLSNSFAAGFLSAVSAFQRHIYFLPKCVNWAAARSKLFDQKVENRPPSNPLICRG
jgi:hypothetical protein